MGLLMEIRCFPPRTPMRGGFLPTLVGVLSLLLICAMVSGCRRPAPAQSDAQVAIEFTPASPVIGTNNLRITITDTQGQPVRLGRLEVEGNMNHAGMTPVFTHLQESEPGRYAGAIEFTMGGDWFLLLSGKSSNGEPFNKQIDVRGVKPK